MYKKGLINNKNSTLKLLRLENFFFLDLLQETDFAQILNRHFGNK